MRSSELNNSLRRGRLPWMKALSSGLLWSVVAASAFAADYYVSPAGNDRNSGTKVAPWQSAEHAGRKARAGDTVIFLPGDYAGLLEPANSGRAGAPIVFKAAERRQARLIGDAANPRDGSYGGRIRLNNVSHIEIRGFDVIDSAV